MKKETYGLLSPLLEAGFGNKIPANTKQPAPVSNINNVGDMQVDAAVNPDEAKIRRAKVRIFFDKLQKNATLMGYLNFPSPIEQAQAITAFAEMVGVPKSQIVPLLTSLKKLATT